jgi:hypothetical protein
MWVFVAESLMISSCSWIICLLTKLMDEASCATNRLRRGVVASLSPTAIIPLHTGWMKDCVECVAWEPLETTLSTAGEHWARLLVPPQWEAPVRIMNVSNWDKMSTWGTLWVMWTNHISGASWRLGNSDSRGLQIMGGLACTPYVCPREQGHVCF